MSSVVENFRIVNGYYTGEMNYGVRSGQGTMRYDSGDVFIGHWFANKTHGRGIMTYASGASYEGDWHKGLRQGHGTYIYANQNKYVGSGRQTKRTDVES